MQRENMCRMHKGEEVLLLFMRYESVINKNIRKNSKIPLEKFRK